MQVVSGEWSNYCGAKRDGNFGKSRAETIRIASRTNEGKEKVNGDKGTDPKDLSVTNQIMNAYKK